MTSIEWTDKTWNPIVGCSIVSPGCTNCYAMKMAARIDKMTLFSHYEGLTKKVNGNVVWTGKLAQANDYVLTAPLRRRKPTMYFVNSMGDLFHEDIPDEWIDRVFAVMAFCPQHTFQVLTKRAERMRDYCVHTDRRFDICQVIDGMYPMRTNASRMARDRVTDWPLPNVWLGVSTEDQARADERIPLLLQTPAAIRFISAEPLIGPIDMNATPLTNPTATFPSGEPALCHLDWIIVGGESGPNARPMHPDWARKIRDDCAAAGVAFFFKQWGEWGDDTGILANGADPIMDGKARSAFWKDGQWEHRASGYAIDLDESKGCGDWVYRLGKKTAGRKLDGKAHNEFPKAKAGEARAASRLDPLTEHPVF